MKKLFLVRTLIIAASLLLQLSAFSSRSHGAAGDVDLSFDPGSGVDGPVTAVVVQPDGRIVIAGYFTTVRGLVRTNLARLNADGRGDATFDAGLTSQNMVNAIALQADGKVLVGGQFLQQYCDESGCYPDFAASVVRLDPNGARDASFTPAVTEWSTQPRGFHAIVPLADGRLLVGGEFYSVNGTNRVGIARLNGNGTLDTSFDPGTGPNGPVQFVGLQPDGKVLIDGRFTTFDGTNCGSLARLNANGTLDSSFNSGFGARHYRDCGGDVCYNVAFPTAVALQPDGKVIAGTWIENWQCDAFEGGCFYSSRYSVSRLNPDGSNDPSFVFTNSVPGGLISGILVQPDGKLLVRHGGFNTSRINRLNANGSWDSSFQPENTSGGANAAALQTDGKVIIGGTSVSVDAANGQRLARLYADGTRDLTFDAGQGLERAVSAVALQPNGKVLLGGPLVVGDPYWGPASDTLAFINGTNRHGRARLNIDGSRDREFVPTPFHPPLEARYHTEDCLGDTRYGCLHGFGSTALLALADGRVLLGGTFITTIYGEEVFYQIYHSFLGRFDATGGLEIEFNLPDVYVNAMAQQPDGKIIIGGNLALNRTNSTVARLNYDGSVDGSFQLSQGPAAVACLALQPDGRVVVGGANSVVRLNGSGSRDSGFGPVALSNGGANALVVQPDGKVLIGGSFTAVHGINRNRIARLNAIGSLDSDFHPGTGADGAVRSIALQPDGRVLLGGDFTTVGGVLRRYVARLHGADVPPSLNIARANALVTISWPSSGGFVLDQSPATTGVWSQVSFPYTNNGNVISVNTTTAPGNKFYRLRKP